MHRVHYTPVHYAWVISDAHLKTENSGREGPGPSAYDVTRALYARSVDDARKGIKVTPVRRETQARPPRA